MAITIGSEIKSILTSDKAINLQDCINSAKEEALRFIDESEFVRKRHEEGRKNSSLESTEEGVLRSAEGIIESYIEKKRIEPQSEVVFFGEHIREALSILKTLWKK